MRGRERGSSIFLWGKEGSFYINMGGHGVFYIPMGEKRGGGGVLYSYG